MTIKRELWINYLQQREGIVENQLSKLEYFVPTVDITLLTILFTGVSLYYPSNSSIKLWSVAIIISVLTISIYGIFVILKKRHLKNMISELIEILIEDSENENEIKKRLKKIKSFSKKIDLL